MSIEGEQPDCAACKRPLEGKHVQSLDGVRFCDVICLRAARPGELAYYAINNNPSPIPPKDE